MDHVAPPVLIAFYAFPDDRYSRYTVDRYDHRQNPRQHRYRYER